MMATQTQTQMQGMALRLQTQTEMPGIALRLQTSLPAGADLSAPNKPLAATNRYLGYDHMTWWVGNAKQTASFFVTRLGFSRVAYQGLETGSKTIASHVVSNNRCVFVFKSPTHQTFSVNAEKGISQEDQVALADMHSHLGKHGDGVKDVAFEVEDATAMHHDAISRGALEVLAPTTIQDDNGQVIIATVKTFGDTTHTLIERKGYRGVFLPGFQQVASQDPINSLLPHPVFEAIDHCAGNQDWGQLQDIAELYENGLGFNQSWSPTDGELSSDFSSMNSIVMASPDGTIKIPLNEPAHGLKKSQIEEFVEYYGGPGIQHVALRTNDIIECVDILKQRGMEFIHVPGPYYQDLWTRLSSAGVHLDHDKEAIEKLNILVDFDQYGYLLQIFTKPLSDRPTVFLEIIQRKTFDGFGAGNVKALFRAIEREQADRGNL